MIYGNEMKKSAKRLIGLVLGSYLYIGVLGLTTGCTSKGDGANAADGTPPPASQSLDNPGELAPAAAPVGDSGAGVTGEPTTPDAPIDAKATKSKAAAKGKAAVKGAKAKKPAKKTK